VGASRCSIRLSATFGLPKKHSPKESPTDNPSSAREARCIRVSWSSGIMAGQILGYMLKNSLAFRSQIVLTQYEPIRPTRSTSQSANLSSLNMDDAGSAFVE